MRNYEYISVYMCVRVCIRMCMQYLYVCNKNDIVCKEKKNAQIYLYSYSIGWKKTSVFVEKIVEIYMCMYVKNGI